MTESEAKKETEKHIQFLRDNWKPNPDYDVIEALREALQALEEVQAYRAIGTVEEFKAIKQWKEDVIESFSKYDVNSVDELMKRFRELTEKAEPKKPYEHNFYEESHYYLCPECRNILSSNQNFCEECGTAIDWE